MLPSEPGVRDIARRLHAAVRELPAISPHGHVGPRILLDDAPFVQRALVAPRPGADPPARPDRRADHG
nr:putative uronate isomerase [uncultured bacterium]